MNEAEIVRVDGPIPIIADAHKDVITDPAAVLIYSVQLANGLLVTSPEGFPAVAPEPRR